jgi:hypothetical protein
MNFKTMHEYMSTKETSKFAKRLFVIISLLGYTICMSGQIKLASAKSLGCDKTYDAYNLKPIFKEIWLNDSILQVQTTASSNCAGVQNLRLETFGPLVCLNFGEYGIVTKLDLDTHKEVTRTYVANCNCVFIITWTITGITKNSKYILLLNGKLAGDYNRDLLEEIFFSYQIDYSGSTYYLKNVVDNKGLSQGIHTFTEGNVTRSKIYRDGKEQTNPHAGASL